MDFLNSLNVVDYVVLVILGISAAFATLRGMTREFLGLLGWFIAVFVARFSAPVLEPVIETYLKVPGLVEAIAYAVPFAMSIVIWFILASLISPALKKAGLKGLDRWLGALFGIVRGVLVVCIIYLGSVMALGDEDRLPEAMRSSISADYIRNVAFIAEPLMPDSIAEQMAGIKRPDASNAEPIEIDTPAFIERGINRVEQGTGNVDDSLNLLSDEQN